MGVKFPIEFKGIDESRANYLSVNYMLYFKLYIELYFKVRARSLGPYS